LARLCSVLNQGLSYPLRVLVTQESYEDVTSCTYSCCFTMECRGQCWVSTGGVQMPAAGGCEAAGTCKSATCWGVLRVKCLWWPSYPAFQDPSQFPLHQLCTNTAFVPPTVVLKMVRSIYWYLYHSFILSW